MTTEQDHDDDSPFKVEDKRRFDSTGAPRDAAQDSGPTAGAEAGPSKASSEGDKTDRSGMTFSSFVVGLAAQALSYLGLRADEGGQPSVDLAQASAMIDVLNLLEEKTRGNLDEDEARLMEEMLYDLRMRYVEARKSAPADATEKN